MDPHDQAVSKAFDARAAVFERGTLQKDPAALGRLVAFAAFPPDARVLDAGCGPGLVAEAFLEAGCRVAGVDLSAEMVARARLRCARFGERARFEHGSLAALAAEGAFDAAVSRLVLHHVPHPLAFLEAQVARVRPGGVVVAADHAGDPDPERARWHQEIERARDTTHTRNLTSGEIADLFARAGLVSVSLVEDAASLDFDEWYERGTPGLGKDEVRRMLLAGRSRAFDPVPRADGGVTIGIVQTLVRGVKVA